MPKLRRSTVIQASPKAVHEYARDPRHWSEWYVGMGESEEITGDGGVGTVVKTSWQAFGVRLPLTVTVTEDGYGAGGSHYRSKVEGGISAQHYWTHVPKGEACESTAETEYTVPGAFLGKIADRLIIERMLEGNMEQTLQNLKLICEAM